MTDLFSAYDDIKNQNAERDERHRMVSAVRRGDVEQILPGTFPENWPKQITANMVNIASRQLGEQLGGLPDFQCKSGRHTTAAAKRAAEKRTRILRYFIECSNLHIQMIAGADRYLSFGGLPIVVEPNFEMNVPTFRIANPVGSYWRLDLFGRVVDFYESWFEPADALAAKFPDYADEIKGRNSNWSGEHSNSQLEVVRAYDKDCTRLFLPDRHVVLAESKNYMDGSPVFVAELPKWDDEVRGQFDEMLWVQLARARMAAYTLEIAHEAVNAPWAMPPDVTQFSLGPKSVIRSANPQQIGRIPLDVPAAAFAENQLLRQEERLAARFPEGMTGNIDASVITGQGVSALLSSVDSQIQVAQENIRGVLGRAASYALQMSQQFFGDMELVAETSEHVDKYIPSKDIAGDYFVKATYGFASGMDANRGLIFMLQGQGAGLLSRETIIDQMASMFGFNSSEEMERMDQEGLSDALKQGMYGLASAVGQMPMMGMDPREAVRQIATVIKERQKGRPLHEAVAKAFEPTKEQLAAAEQAQAEQDPLAALMGGGAPPGGGEPVDPTAPPQGGSRDISMMLAGLTQSGEPNLQANISRMIPTVG